MSMKPKSCLDKILEVLQKLNPINAKDPIDAKTMADLATIPCNRAGDGLSRLHKIGCLVRIGTLDHYALYIRTNKPLPKRSSSIERRYKRQLDKKASRYSTLSPKEIARDISHTVIAALRPEIRGRARRHKTGNASRQLTLFRNA